jgi:hypothetical protein
MNESAISLLNQFPETKAEIDNFAKIVIEQIDLGEFQDVLKFAARFKALAKLEEKLFSNVLFKDAVLEAAEKYGKSFEKGNAKFDIRETGVTYDYAGCGDVEWEQIDSSIKVLQERKKERETFLKSITGEMTVFGEDGAQIMPAIKRSSTSVVITLK